MTATTWAGVRVLVTGADGFIGSHLTERLVALGARVRAFCVYNSHGSLGWLDHAAPEVRQALDVRLGDIRDARFVEAACQDIDVVFHLAALIAIPYSYTAPQSFVDTNVIGTLNILEGARRAGCRRVVQTSTSEVYGTPATLPILETHPLQGQSPYSASKIGADKLCESYFCSFQVPVVTVRPFNTYGPRQSARAVLPTILTQMLAGQRAIKLGSIDPRRDLLFVADTVEGFVKAGATPGIDGETVQLGTGRAVSVAELFEIARAAVGSDAVIERDEQRVRPGASEVMVLLADASKAQRLLNWTPAVTLEQGLARTVEWLRHHQHLYARLGYQV